MKPILLFSAVVLAAAGSLPAQTIEATGTGVGIGTASPDGVLHVVTPASTDTNQPRFLSGSSTAGQWNEIFLGASVANYSTAVLRHFNGQGTSSSALLTLMHYGDQLANGINLKGGGNVGIGTTNPLSPLHVMGVGRFGLNNTGVNNIGGILVASGTGTGGARQYWIGASDPTAHNNNMFEISDYNGTTNSPLLTIYGTHAGASGGFVGIGTTTPGYKLEVAGSVRATSFISNSGVYPDFVFKPDYRLRPLAEVEAVIRSDGHLPDIPSEAEVKMHGVDLASQQAKLLQKVEELTLYVIELEKQNVALREEMKRIGSELPPHP